MATRPARTIDRTATKQSQPPARLRGIPQTFAKAQADDAEAGAFRTVDSTWAAASGRTTRASTVALEAAIARRTAQASAGEVEDAFALGAVDDEVEVEQTTTELGRSAQMTPKPQEVAQDVTPPTKVFRPAPAEQAAPLEGAPVKATTLTTRPITAEAVDCLWDWIRQDADKGHAFLGQTFPTSLALHKFMATLNEYEPYGTAIVRAVHVADTLIGFAMLLPIQDGCGVMHIYLMPSVRGTLAQLTPYLVNAAQALRPDLKLAVSSRDAGWARLHRQVLTPLGFREHTLFVR